MGKGSYTVLQNKSSQPPVKQPRAAKQQVMQYPGTAAKYL
jgi:hypothetical protein